MSSNSGQVPNLGNGNAENGNVSELISILRSAFQPAVFHNVERILATREANMKREIAYWKREYEIMEKKHCELALEKLEIEDKRNKHKQERDFLREKITRLREGQRVHCDREKRAEDRNAKLFEDFTKAETENRKLRLQISDLDSSKKRAELELDTCKERFEELCLRVLRLETDIGVMNHVEDPVCVEMEGPEKTSDNGTSENEEGFAAGSENLNRPQVKESGPSGSNSHEKDHSLAGGGSAFEFPEVESKPLQEAGPHPFIMGCHNAKPQNQLVFNQGSSNRLMDTAAGRRTGSVVVIEINDSDDEMPTKDGKTSVPNIVASGVTLSDKENKSAHSGQSVDENGRSCAENFLLASSSKRKRASCTNIGENKNDYVDMTPISKRKTKTVQELIRDGSDSDSSSSDSSSSGSDIESLITMLRKRKGQDKTWAFKVDMISELKRDPELCMNAVCALYRQQMCKVKPISGSLLTKNPGFNRFDALRGTSLGEYLTNGDPKGKLKKSVLELQQYDPNGLNDCINLAIHHSDQLFEIYQKKEDPFFLPS